MKKLFTMLLLTVFCTSQSVFAITDADAVQLKDVFENNYQSVSTEKSVNAQLSPIEEIFNGKENAVSGNILRQVGYDHFNSFASAGTSATGKYDENYKLSIGEHVNVYSYGNSVDVMAMSGSNLLAPVAKAEVDSNGSIFIQGIGLIKAENRTLKDVENEANKLASKKYKNMKVKLTVSSGSEFSVFVYGEVNRPGKVYIGNNSSILDALSAAGGVKKTGTLRNIQYNANTDVDLYEALFLGNDGGIILKPNDKIFVGTIGGVIALKNGVTTTGIYEIKDGENLSDITRYAGGLLPTTQFAEVTMISFDENLNQKTARNIGWGTAQTTELKSGDTIEFKELYNNAENIVTIQGNIKHPATFAYKDGMRLSDILKSEDELLEETFINQAVIRRVSGNDNTVETIPVFLKEFFAGMNDPVLQPRDVITIYKSTNSRFVDVYGCINTPKHLPYINNMTLNDVMSDIKFMESDVKKDMKNVSYETSDEEGSVRLTGSTENSNQLIPTENVAVEITNALGKTEIYYMYDIMINSDKIKSISISPEDRIFFRTLRNNEIMKTVKVSGFVKEPGVYSFVRGQKLSDILEMAGGLAEDADLRGLVYKRRNLKNKQTSLAQKNNERDIKLLEGRIASGYKQDTGDQQKKLDMIAQLKADEKEVASRYNGQISLNIKNNDINKISKLDNITVQDGDDIYVPRMSTSISVIGEVYNEQSFVYKGSRAKDYIREVGGYTPNANKFRIYRVGVNGRAEKIGRNGRVEPGDTIVVPRRIAGNDWITPICETLQGLASVVVMAFAINKW